MKTSRKTKAGIFAQSANSDGTKLSALATLDIMMFAP